MWEQYLVATEYLPIWQLIKQTNFLNSKTSDKAPYSQDLNVIYNSTNTFTVIVRHDIYELSLFCRTLNTSYVYLTCLYNVCKIEKSVPYR